MLTYKILRSILPPTTAVYLEGKRIGRIRHTHHGFRYFPGTDLKHGGEMFKTMDECKRSLEAA